MGECITCAYIMLERLNPLQFSEKSFYKIENSVHDTEWFILIKYKLFAYSTYMISSRLHFYI